MILDNHTTEHGEPSDDKSLTELTLHYRSHNFDSTETRNLWAFTHLDVLKSKPYKKKPIYLLSIHLLIVYALTKCKCLLASPTSSQQSRIFTICESKQLRRYSHEGDTRFNHNVLLSNQRALDHILYA